MTSNNLQTGPESRDVWSSKLELNSLGTTANSDTINGGSPASGDSGHRSRTSKIEREIIWAVVVLYAGIIACFAGLHIYGLTLG